MGLEVVVRRKTYIQTKFLKYPMTSLLISTREWKIAKHSKREDLMPLTFQLSTTWEEAIPDERKTCIEKATKACEVICSVIAPKDGEKLFQAIRQPTANDLDEPTEDLIASMSAYRDAMTKKC